MELERRDDSEKDEVNESREPAAILADETGRPREDFEADVEYPDWEDQEIRDCE